MSYSIPLWPAPLRLEAGLENTFKLAALVGKSTRKPALHSRRWHERQRLDVRDARKHLSRGGVTRGLFTSPQVSFRERIQINRQLINQADVVPQGAVAR